MTTPGAAVGPLFPFPDQIIRAVDHAELEPLVTVAARENALGLASRVRLRTPTVCYECRLAESNARVDYAIALFPAFDAGATGAVRDLHRRHRDDDAWTRALGFLGSWLDGTLDCTFPFVCVAFDLEKEPVTLPAPCLSLCVDSDFFARRLGFTRGSRMLPEELEVLAGRSYERLLGNTLPQPSSDRLRRCLSEPGVEPRHISFMTSRSPPTSKVDLKVPVAAVESLLLRLGWPAKIHGIESCIRELVPSAEEVQLNLVYHPELSPVLEVEFLTDPRQVSLLERRSFLARLVERSLCSREKAEVLLRAWERPLTQVGGGLSVAKGWYVKVRLLDGVPVDAKAYLGLMPRILGAP
jgi:hypothetical protein